MNKKELDTYTAQWEAGGLEITITGEMEKIQEYMEAKMVAPKDVGRLESDRTKSAALDVLLDEWEDESQPKSDIGHIVQLAYDMFRGEDGA